MRARRKKQQRQHRSNNFKQKVFAVLKKMNQRHDEVEDCADDDILAEDFDDLDEFDSNSDIDSIGESNSLESFQISEWYRKPEIKPFFNNSQVELADERITGGETNDTGSNLYINKCHILVPSRLFKKFIHL